MTDVVGIWNLSLANIGVAKLVYSYDPLDQTQEAAVCNSLWKQSRNYCLRKAPWNFSRTVVRLALLDSTGTLYPGWKYVYQYPSNCKFAKAVCTAAGIRNGYYGCSFWWSNGSSAIGGMPHIPFEVAASPDGNSKVILTDIPDAYLLYFFEQENTELYDDMFVEWLAWFMATKIAGPLKASPQLLQYARQQEKLAYNDALAQALNEVQQDPERDSVSILVRSGGIGWYD